MTKFEKHDDSGRAHRLGKRIGSLIAVPAMAACSTFSAQGGAAPTPRPGAEITHQQLADNWANSVLVNQDLYSAESVDLRKLQVISYSHPKQYREVTKNGERIKLEKFAYQFINGGHEVAELDETLAVPYSVQSAQYNQLRLIVFPQNDPALVDYASRWGKSDLAAVQYDITETGHGAAGSKNANEVMAAGRVVFFPAAKDMPEQQVFSGTDTVVSEKIKQDIERVINTEYKQFMAGTTDINEPAQVTFLQ